ncbi:colicin-like pore-forming protein [Pseudomonas sp. EA_65y_Pfl1_P113]|uniref:colicin-like pore-forming protein n=1 Tax=Pseudomonas sp. EA_65y_Pfl1_P113 TaxID=3088692 RepID=UPI0030D94DFB
MNRWGLWISYDHYIDIGVDPWKWIPLQLSEAILEINNNTEYAKNNLKNTLESEISSAGVAQLPAKVTPSEKVTNNSISALNGLIQKRNEAIQENKAVLAKLPKRQYGRSVKAIVDEVMPITNNVDSDAMNRMIDLELAWLVSTRNIEIHATAIQLLHEKLDQWQAIKEKQQRDVAAAKAAADKAIADAAAKAKLAADEQTKYEDAIKATASFYEALGAKFGDKAKTLAKELEEGAKGTSIRSADEALKAFDKYKDVLNKKFNSKEREAAAKYIASMDFEAIGKATAKFSKGFGYVGHAFNAKDVYIEFGKSQASGDWNPFFVKLETVGLGMAATALVAAMFGFAAVTPVGILGFSALMAVSGAAIDDKLVESINKFIMQL